MLFFIFLFYSLCFFLSHPCGSMVFAWMSANQTEDRPNNVCGPVFIIRLGIQYPMWQVNRTKPYQSFSLPFKHQQLNGAFPSHNSVYAFFHKNKQPAKYYYIVIENSMQCTTHCIKLSGSQRWSTFYPWFVSFYRLFKALCCFMK